MQVGASRASRSSVMTAQPSLRPQGASLPVPVQTLHVLTAHAGWGWQGRVWLAGI